MPATTLEAASISARRSPGPASLDPNTMRPFSIASSLAVLGSDSAGGGFGVVRVAGVVLDNGRDRISRYYVS
jgi:hypothetical protein